MDWRTVLFTIGCEQYGHCQDKTYIVVFMNNETQSVILPTKQIEITIKYMDCYPENCTPNIFYLHLSLYIYIYIYIYGFIVFIHILKFHCFYSAILKFHQTVPKQDKDLPHKPGPSLGCQVPGNHCHAGRNVSILCVAVMSGTCENPFSEQKNQKHWSHARNLVICL